MLSTPICDLYVQFLQLCFHLCKMLYAVQNSTGGQSCNAAVKLCFCCCCTFSVAIVIFASFNAVNKDDIRALMTGNNHNIHSCNELQLIGGMRFHIFLPFPSYLTKQAAVCIDNFACWPNISVFLFLPRWGMIVCISTHTQRQFVRVVSVAGIKYCIVGPKLVTNTSLILCSCALRLP